MTPGDFHYQSIEEQLDNELPRTFFHSNQHLNCFPTWECRSFKNMCRKWILTWVDQEFGEFAAVLIEFAFEFLTPFWNIPNVLKLINQIIVLWHVFVIYRVASCLYKTENHAFSILFLFCLNVFNSFTYFSYGTNMSWALFFPFGPNMVSVVIIAYVKWCTLLHLFCSIVACWNNLSICQPSRSIFSLIIFT